MSDEEAGNRQTDATLHTGRRETTSQHGERDGIKMLEPIGVGLEGIMLRMQADQLENSRGCAG